MKRSCYCEYEIWIPITLAQVSSAIRMMMGIGTPISQSNIERMHASFCLQIPDVDTFHRAGTGFRRYG
ncbi:hypothetical protein H0A73_18135 [Alcaligenaceae bacterium]|nr:hypothetical protein [Alcaligenaceae bacterium]